MYLHRTRLDNLSHSNTSSHPPCYYTSAAGLPLAAASDSARSASATASSSASASAASHAASKVASPSAARQAALARRGIEHTSLRVVDGCAPSYQSCRHYRADVLVISGREHRGDVLCRWRWTGCALTVTSLGIHREPLPDVVRRLLPWDLDLLMRDLAARIGLLWR